MTLGLNLRASGAHDPKFTGIAKSFSLEVFYNIADALEIEPATLLSAPTQFDNLLKQNT